VTTKKDRMARLAFLLLGLCCISSALNFSAVFGNGMVLQHSAKAAVYGLANMGEKVRVTLTNADSGLIEEVPPTTAFADGSWKVLLASQTPGGNFTIQASGDSGAGATLSSVSFGDVWLCSGQSNMELGLTHTLTRNESYAALKANKYSNIRIFHFDHNPQPSPQYIPKFPDSVVTPWQTAANASAACSATSTDKCDLGSFSAACYYFAESLTDRMRKEGADKVIPIGLIMTAFGGTMIESWVPPEQQLASCTNITCTANQTEHFNEATAKSCLAIKPDKQALAEYTVEAMWTDPVTALKNAAKGAGANGFLYNGGMIAPFVNQTVKGFLWYQVSRLQVQ
jgi:sialate O-acetylesterase